MHPKSITTLQRSQSVASALRLQSAAAPPSPMAVSMSLRTALCCTRAFASSVSDMHPKFHTLQSVRSASSAARLQLAAPPSAMPLSMSRRKALCCTRAFSSSVSSLISEEEVRRFEEDGATVVRQLFPPEWLDQLRATAEVNMKNPGVLCDEHVKPGEPGRFHDDQFLWRRHETMRRFIYESPAAEIARHMMRGKQVQLFYDQLFVKEPGTRKVTPWHNDHSYWQLKGNQVISLWLALDHVPKSSCVKYVKGSHKWQLLHKISSFSGDEQRYKDSASLPDIPDIDSKRDEYELLAWDMEPGDCLVHHSFAVHGAPGISSQSGRRRAYATRWFGEDVAFDPRPGTMHYTWVDAGLDQGLKAEEPLKASLFPKVTPAPELRV